MAERRSAKAKKHMKRHWYIAQRGGTQSKKRMVDTTSQWHRVDQHSGIWRDSTSLLRIGLLSAKQSDRDWIPIEQLKPAAPAELPVPACTSNNTSTIGEPPTATLQQQQRQQSKQHQQPMHRLNQQPMHQLNQQHMHQLNQNQQSKQHQHMHQHKQPAPATISTSNTSSKAGQQRQQHKRSSIQQQQNQNGKTYWTNKIPKKNAKTQCTAKKTQNYVDHRLFISCFFRFPHGHGSAHRLYKRRIDLTKGLVLMNFDVDCLFQKEEKIEIMKAPYTVPGQNLYPRTARRPPGHSQFINDLKPRDQ